MRFVEILKPAKSMLKFKLPYGPGFLSRFDSHSFSPVWFVGKTSYLQGEILLPVWGPPTTTETRLVPDHLLPLREYDHVEYEEKMFYFNTVVRMTWYPHELDSIDGITFFALVQTDIRNMPLLWLQCWGYDIGKVYSRDVRNHTEERQNRNQATFREDLARPWIKALSVCS